MSHLMPPKDTETDQMLLDMIRRFCDSDEALREIRFEKLSDIYDEYFALIFGRLLKYWMKTSHD